MNNLHFKRVSWILGLTVAMLLVFSVSNPAIAAPEHAREQHVIVISFDQGGGQEIKKADNMPTFHEMVEQGAVDWKAYTIVPSITLPSHTSMLTGVGIQAHQITWNNYQPKRGVVTVPTIFSLAHEQGLTTAMYVGKEKFKHLILPDSVDHFEVSGDAKQVAIRWARNWPDKKYNLSFLHFADIDAKGHAHGLHSAEWIQALADTDEALKTVRDAVVQSGLQERTVIILTADHGGHNVEGKDGKMYGAHGSSMPEDVEIPWVAWGHGVKPGFEITAPIVTYDTAATTLWLLGIPVPESFWGRPAVSAFTAE